MARPVTTWLALAWLAGMACLPGAAARAETADAAGLLERANRWVFALNDNGARMVSDAWERLGMRRPEAEPVVEALGRMVFNFVNEPVAMVSHAVAGDARRLGDTAARFAINTTLGMAGLFDRARERGFEPSVADLGLSLCRHGVPAGPYVVVPILGPRMLRDAASDIVVSNLVIVAMLSPLVGQLLTPTTLLAIAVLDEAAVLAVARNLDPAAAALNGLDYEATRAAYEAERAMRCAEPIGSG